MGRGHGWTEARSASDFYSRAHGCNSIARRAARRLLSSALGLLIAGAASAADVGHVAVLHHDGSDYSRQAQGEANYAPRMAIAKSFYEAHADAYDFLIVFPAFDVDFGASVEGIHSLVRNSVTGTGVPFAENGSLFGSPRRLLGYVDVGSLRPTQGVHSVDAALSIAAHEVAHQWSGKAVYSKAGAVSTGLLGSDAAHWSFFLDSDSSVLYGSDWEAAGAGAFRAKASGKRYSSLDLYLMGLLASAEVDPITLLQPASGTAHLATDLPPPDGTIIQAAAESIAVGQLITAMGERFPNASNSQRNFRAAFALLLPPGGVATEEQVAFVDSVRREFANRFFFLTRGRAVMDTDLVEVPPGSVASEPAVARGLAFLLGRQKADGSWADRAETVYRDTQEAIEALSSYVGEQGVEAALDRGVAFLAAAAPRDVDSAARRVLGLAVAGRATASALSDLEALLASQRRADGLNGLAYGYAPTVLDVALATNARLAGGRAPTDVQLASQHLLSIQRSDGSWSWVRGGSGAIEPTIRALEVLRLQPQTSTTLAAVNAAFAALAQRRQGDGSYLDDLTSPASTAQAVLALGRWSRLIPAEAAASAASLLGRQQSDGGWAASSHHTSLVLRALRVAMTPNLAVADVVATPQQVEEGGAASVRATIRNDGYATAPSFLVRAFDSGGLPFGDGVTVESLAPGASITINLPLNSTGHADSIQVFVVADPAGVIGETREDDNRAAAPLRVTPPPPEPELYVVATSLSSMPAAVEHTPQPLLITANVGNAGAKPANGVTVALLVDGVQVATSVVDLAARSMAPVTFSTSVIGRGSSLSYAINVDATQQFAEADEGNNSASAVLSVKPTIDVGVSGLIASPASLSQGAEVWLDYALLNDGTIEAGAVVRCAIRDATGSLVANLPGQSVVLGPAGGATGRFSWFASTAGSLVAEVSVQVPGDLDPTDNVRQASFAVETSPMVNLQVRPGALRVDPDPPLQGAAANAIATITNSGGSDSGPFAVEFYLGDSTGTPAGRAEVAGLAAGASVDVTVTLGDFGDKPVDLVVYVDADGTVSELDESDNTLVLPIQPRVVPNLVVSDADILPQTTVARVGTQVEVAVSVYNAGDQPATAFSLELFDGDPDSGGSLVGRADIGGLAPRSRAGETFNWATGSTTGRHQLVLVANKERTAIEATYKDNLAVREVMVQDGALTLTEPWFSPNGDGIKDATEAFYRVASGQVATVRIRDGAGNLVRTLEGGTESGSVVWDGRDDQGRVVRDADYLVAVLANGTAIANTTVSVDTNRLPLEESAGTPLLFTMVPTREGPVPRIGSVIFAPDDSALFVFDERRKSDNTVERGWYRQEPDGGPSVLVIRASDTEGCEPPAAMSPDGDTIACYRDAPSPTMGLYSMTQRTFRPVAAGSGPVFSPDGSRMLLLTSLSAYGPEQLEVVNVATGGRDVIDVSGDPGSGWGYGGFAGFAEYAFAPDGTRVSFIKGSALYVAVLGGGAPVQLLPPGAIGTIYSDPSYTWFQGSQLRDVESAEAPRHAWTPGGDEIVYATPGEIMEEFDLGACEALVCRQANTQSCDMVGLESCYRGAGAGIAAVNVGSGSTRTVFAAPDLGYQQFNADEASVGTSRWGDSVLFTYSDGYLPARDLSFVPTAGALTSRSLQYFPTGDRWGSSISNAVRGLRVSPQGTLAYVDSDGAPHVVGTSANLRVGLGATRPPGSVAFALKGTATDIHFQEYAVTVRPYGSGEVGTVITRSATPVVNSLLAEWVAPDEGLFEVTLTARDRAGNVRSRSTIVATSRGPAISAFTRDPQVFSPNGDGRVDASMMRYEVASPVSAEVVISSLSAPVRHLAVTHLVPGAFVLQWDGRDDAFQTVPDGYYTADLAGNRVDFVVDTVAPRTSLFLDCARGGGRCGATDRDGTTSAGEEVKVPRATAVEEWGVGDASASEWSLEVSTADAPTDFGPTRSGSGKVVGAWVVPVPTVDANALPFSQARGRRVRVAATDVAGNTVLTEPQLHPERIVITGIGDAEALDPANGTVTVDGVTMPRIDMLKARTDTHEIRFQAKRYGIAIDTTIAAPIVSYEVFTSRGGTGPFVAAVAEMVSEYALVWDARSLTPGRYVVLVRARDAAGRTFEDRIVLDDPGASIAACVSPGAPERILANVYATTAELETGVVRVLSEEGVPATEAPVFFFELEGIANLDASALPACRYRLEFEGSTSSGKRVAVSMPIDICGVHLTQAFRYGVKTLQVAETYRKPVASFEVYRAGRLLAATGPFEGSAAALSYSVDATTPEKFVTRFQDGSYVEALGSSDFHSCQALGGQGDGNTCASPPNLPVAEVSTTFGVLCQPHSPTYSVGVAGKCGDPSLAATAQQLNGSFSRAIPLVMSRTEEFWQFAGTFEGTGMPEGRYSLALMGRPAIGSPRFVVDRTPPVTTLVGPVGRVCPNRTTLPGGTPAILLEGSASDAFLGELTPRLRSAGEAEFQAVTLLAATKPPGATTVSGVLGAVSMADRPAGDYEVSLGVWDGSGGSVCTAPLAFHYIDGVRLTGPSITPALYSPDGDGESDVTALQFQIDEEAEVEVVAAPVSATDGSGQAIYRSWHWLGPVNTFLGGQTLAGTALPDGEYVFRVTATNRCGDQAKAELNVAIDTLPPEVEIASPADGEPIGATLTLVGRVHDPHLKRYEVWVQPAGSAGAVLLGSGSAPQTGSLGAFSTASLPIGPAKISVVAFDQVGHRAEASVKVEIAVRKLIDGFVVRPLVVSPNGDGFYEEAIVEYSLVADAETLLEIVDANGGSVAVPGPPTLASAGPHEVLLDASLLVGLRDAQYSTRLSAWTPTASDSAAGPLSVDTTPPAVTVASPALNGWVKGQASVSATVDDPHPDAWRLLAGLAAAQPVEVATGTGPLAGPFTALTGLADGTHVVMLEASDSVGNSRTASVTFHSDATAPVASIDTPLNGALLSSVNGLVAVRATIEEANVARITLEARRGDGSTTVLFDGDAIPTNGSLASWDLSSEVDGQVEVVLSVVDRADNRVEARTQVEVDRTPPSVHISSPRDGRLALPARFLGSVQDGSLESWTLEIAEGLPGLAFGFVQIASGTGAVVDGALAELTSPPADGVYTARLSARDRAGNVGEDETSFTVDSTPPEPPSALSAAVQRPADVLLAWSASPSVDVAGYRILRATEGGILEPVGTGIVSGTEYLDAGRPDGSWSYAVVAVDDAGLESPPSNLATARVDTTGPVAFLIRPAPGRVGGAVSVVGTAASSDDFKEFRLSIGEGGSPSSFTLIRRSSAAVTNGELGAFDTRGFANGSLKTILLEAEDLVGNRTEARLTLEIDNDPPAAPLLLSAVAAGSDVTLTWQAVPDAGLAGYLLFRNGALANAPESFDDLTPYLLPKDGTSYVDVGVPDGTYTYHLVAMDTAANVGPQSNGIAVTIDQRAPAAKIVSPAHLARLSEATWVTADVVDQDVASVRFQARAAGQAEFVDLGAPVASPPFLAAFDPSQLGADVIELRAVATDTAGNVDPSPETIWVFHEPAVDAPSVTAVVSGWDATVDWQSGAVGSAPIGFTVDRDGQACVSPVPVPTGIASASATLWGTPGYAYDRSYSTTWAGPAAVPVAWTLALVASAMVSKINAVMPVAATVDVQVRIDGEWIRVASGSSPDAYGWLEVPVTPALQVDGVRFAFTSAPAGSVQLREVTLTLLPFAPPPPLAESLALGTHDYVVAAIGRFGGAASTTASARIYQPTIDATPEVVSSETLPLTGGAARPSDVVELVSDGVVVASVTADEAGRFAGEVPLHPGENLIHAVATDAAGNRSVPSAAVAVFSEAPPQAQVTLALDSVTGSDVALSFTVAGDDSAVSRYELRRSTGGATTVAASLAPSARRALDTGVPSGTYSYTVVPVAERGMDGAASNAVTAVVVAEPPSPPSPSRAPVIQAPTVAGTPLAVSTATVTIAGDAPIGTFVDVYRNGYLAGSAPTSGFSITETPLDLNGPSSGRGELALSADGTVVAFVYYAQTTGRWAVAVENRGTGAVSKIERSDLNFTGTPALSRDGGTVVVGGAAGTSLWESSLYVIDVATGAVRKLLPNETRYEGGPAIDAGGARVAYWAYRTGDTACLAWADVQTGEEHVVAESPDFEAGTPVWLGESSLAVALWPTDWSLDVVLAQFDLGTGVRTDLASAWSIYEPLSASVDGDRVAFGADDANGLSFVEVVDVATGATHVVDALPWSGSAVALSPEGTEVAWGEAWVVKLWNVETQETTNLLWRKASQNLWTADGVFLTSDSTRSSFLEWGAQFEIDGVELAGGDNVIVAVARNDGGTSPPSMPILLTLDASSLADIAVSGSVQPPVTVAGNSATAYVRVSNGGGAAVANLLLDLSIEGADRALHPLPAVNVAQPIAPGAQVVVPVRFAVPTVAGDAKVLVLADPAHAVPDANRDNNSAVLPFVISSDATLDLQASVSPADLQSTDAGHLSVRVVNPGPDRNLVLRSQVEDPRGAVAFGITPDQVFSPLNGASEAAFTRDFAVSGLLAGSYQVAVEALDQGNVVARRTIPITVVPDRRTGLSLVASRSSYQEGETAEVLGRVENLSVNAFLVGADYRLEVRDSAGVIVRTFSSALPSMPPGGTLSRGTVLEGLALGSYSVSASVLLGEAVLATALSTFEVTGRPLLIGTIEVPGFVSVPAAVPMGTPVPLAFNVTNLGSAASADGVAHVAVVDGAGAVVWSTDVALAALAPGEAFGSTLSVPTTSLEYRLYAVWLTCSLGGEPATALASTRFRVADAVAPAVAIVNVTEGMYVRGTLTLLVDAYDEVSGVSAVRASVDGGPQMPLSLTEGSPLAGRWSASLVLGADGPHSVVVTAADLEGNDGAASPTAANPVAVTVIADGTPPQVSITGVSEGAVTASSVVPSILATDANLASLRAVLDGTRFEPGDSIGAEGEHLLVATATDRAANQASAQVRFAIDRTAPGIVVSGVSNGQFLAGPAQPVIAISDPHLAATEITLNGAPFASGTSISADGAYLLAVRAIDTAGNEATHEVAFVVDQVAPEIVLGGFAEGDYVSTDVAPTFGASDANIESVNGTLDGAPFASGTAVNTEGLHVLVVTAQDAAGNQTTRSGTFTIDRTAPAISLQGFTDGQFGGLDVTPTYDIVEANLATVVALLDGAPFEAAVAVGAEGEHVLAVVATDKAGNRAERSGTFTIDRTAPLITISGFEETGFFSSPVAPRFSATDTNLASVVGLLDGLPADTGQLVSAEGPHVLVVTALDRAGNRSERTGTFTVDTGAPVITVGGFVDGEVTSGPVSPTIGFEDVNLELAEAWLDGLPFVDGLIVEAEGIHTLTASARDRAGNTSSVAASFIIDASPPVITISGVTDGAFVNHEVTLAYQVSEEHLQSSYATLDGSSFASGTVVSAEGAHSLLVSAEDAAGNRSSETLSFVIDTTPPTVSISGVEDGAVYPAEVAPLASAADENLFATSVTLDGAPFASGSVIGAAGAHVLYVRGEDKAGNVTERTVRFSIGASVPFELTKRLVGKSTRPLVLVMRGACDGLEGDAARVSSFLRRSLAPSGPYLAVVTREDSFLEALRSGSFNVFVLVSLADDSSEHSQEHEGGGGDHEGCGVDDDEDQDHDAAHDSAHDDGRDVSDGDDDEGEDEEDDDRNGGGALRVAIARELTETVHAGRAGVLVIRERPEAEPWLRELLGADLTGSAGAEAVRLDPPIASGGALAVSGASVDWKVESSVAAGVFTAPHHARNRVAAVAKQQGLGRAIGLGFDLSVAAPVEASEAAARAMFEWVTPDASTNGPLSVVGVEVEVVSLGSSSRLRAIEILEPGLEALVAIPETQIIPPGTSFQWEFDLDPAAPSLLRYLARLPEQEGTYTTTTEVSVVQGGGASLFEDVTLDLLVLQTPTDLMESARNAVAVLSTVEGASEAAAAVGRKLTRVEVRAPDSRREIERNIDDLLDAVSKLEKLNGSEAVAVRLALDELIRYWEARWYVQP